MRGIGRVMVLGTVCAVAGALVRDARAGTWAERLPASFCQLDLYLAGAGNNGQGLWTLANGQLSGAAFNTGNEMVIVCPFYQETYRSGSGGSPQVSVIDDTAVVTLSVDLIPAGGQMGAEACRSG
jgi:hypothetical protein